ncbi:MAG: D-alanine--D-alanine ligase [Myxococcota bacterium]|jgi:D-alanine-D-alanine ligase|nr:D-alanine--D-alanine ligase [Myxococcota bacterium]
MQSPKSEGIRAKINGRFRNKKVLLLLGGETAEREVSLKTGAAIEKALRSRAYDVEAFDWSSQRASELLESRPDVVFNALHGGAGENGELQGLLEILKIPYTGSGVLSSALCMDKERTKRLAAACGVPTAEWQTLGRASALELPCPLPFPCVVKPSEEGSSVGVSIVHEASAYPAAVQAALQGRGEVMVERYVAGKEVTVAVVDGVALGTCEIVPAQGFYDYAAKYQRNDTRYLTPSTLPPQLDAQVMELAVNSYSVLGCRGVARVDFLVERDRDAFLLELNTVPGMTEKSLVPKIAAACGIDFDTLCEWLLDRARCDSD